MSWIQRANLRSDMGCLRCRLWSDSGLDQAVLETGEGALDVGQRRGVPGRRVRDHPHIRVVDRLVQVVFGLAEGFAERAFGDDDGFHAITSFSRAYLASVHANHASRVLISSSLGWGSTGEYSAIL